MTDETTTVVEDTVETPQEPLGAPESDETPVPADSQTDPETVSEAVESDPEVFPRKVVEELREEAAKYRSRAKDRDGLARRLHTALVAATGRLADPTDLPYADEHLATDDALTAALDELLTAKPHLASRRPRGDVGQGMAGASATVDLAGMLRARA